MRAGLLAIIVLGFALPAAAGDYCQQGGYHECDTTTTTAAQTTTSSIMDTTTTTLTSTTSSAPTTTVPTESTTTTAPPSTSSTSPPDVIAALWDSFVVCEAITATWGEGIVQVDLHQRLPEGDFGPADGITPFTESGQVKSTEGAFPDSEWILIPVVETGFAAVPPSQSYFPEPCEEPTTPSSVGPTGSTLPFTGPFENVTALAASAVALIVLGWLLVKEARR